MSPNLAFKSQESYLEKLFQGRNLIELNKICQRHCDRPKQNDITGMRLKYLPEYSVRKQLV